MFNYSLLSLSKCMCICECVCVCVWQGVGVWEQLQSGTPSSPIRSLSSQAQWRKTKKQFCNILLFLFEADRSQSGFSKGAGKTTGAELPGYCALCICMCVCVCVCADVRMCGWMQEVWLLPSDLPPSIYKLRLLWHATVCLCPLRPVWLIERPKAVTSCIYHNARKRKQSKRTELWKTLRCPFEVALLSGGKRNIQLQNFR